MTQVRVRLHTARVQLAFEGEESVFERHVEPLLLRLAGGVGATTSRPAPPPEEAAEEVPEEVGWRPGATTFGTFQRQLADGLGGTPSRIAAYAFYLWNYEKRETFGVEEIAGCFAADEAEAPADLRQACVELERRRILQPAAHEDTWRLTPKGTNQVRKLLR